MPLTSYEEARPWAKAIREEVLARRMPKWHAARGYGEFTNDRSLTPFEIALVVAWVDGGALRDRAVVAQAFRPASAGPAPAFTPPSPVATRKLSCRDQGLPRGRLLAVRPELKEGGNVGISILQPDGRQDVVAWIRGFEKKFTETYWLRTPIDLQDGARLQAESEGRCHVTVMLAPEPRPRRAP
jgi:hypothetical protein